MIIEINQTRMWSTSEIKSKLNYNNILVYVVI
jgi:hypothetical protein